jgi:hypothetical protein
MDRVRLGYEQDSELSKESGNDGTYRRDELGLYWTEQNQPAIPDYDALREECAHAAHAQHYAGHYGVNRTLKKA